MAQRSNKNTAQLEAPKMPVLEGNATESGKTITALIAKCIASTATTRLLIHDTAVRCILHAEKHGDVMLADRLVKGVRGMDQQGLMLWFKTFTPIAWNNATNKCSMLPKGSQMRENLVKRNGQLWSSALAFETPWFNLEANVERNQRAPAFAEDTIVKLVYSSKARMAKAVAAGTFKGDAKEAAQMLVAMEKALMEINPSKVKAIKLEIEAAQDTEDAKPATNDAAPATSRRSNPRIKQVA